MPFNLQLLVKEPVELSVVPGLVLVRNIASVSLIRLPHPHTVVSVPVQMLQP